MQCVARELKSLLWALALCLFGFAIVCHAQDQSAGFISIDCGLAEGSDYIDANTGIKYSTDASFVDTGENSSILTEYMTDLEKQLWTVRSFPDFHRNCYNLSAAQGKGDKYSIRATFMYGNYDSKNQTPTFDLHLGVERWTTIAPESPTDIVRKEIIHVPSSNYLYVCLVNTDKGTPFISALEVRRVNEMAYPTSDSRESLAVYDFRYNLAPLPSRVIRYPDDVYDRLWSPYETPTYWAELSTSQTGIHQNDYDLPATVMSSAVKPKNDTQNLEFYWEAEDPNIQFYSYFHFTELEQLPNNQTREFYIYLNGRNAYNSTVQPSYLSTLTIYDTVGDSKVRFNYSLRKTEDSSFPPIINAIELYTVVRFLQSQTEENDVHPENAVHAIVNIKSTYELKRSNWQGDPCLPKADLWEGLDCSVSDNKSMAPRIKGLNLSSSGLTGNVSPFLSNLTFLEYLDLSNNSLTGLVPDFLAELPSLKVLNLTGNNFSGSIPQKLVDKAKNGLLLRIEGFGSETPNHCESGDGSECKKKKSKKFMVPLVTSLIASLIILAALIVLWRLRRTKNQVPKSESVSNSKDGFLEFKKLRLTYSKILEITNNFKRVLGKGGFGTVYHGVLAGNQVAVKLLSPSSVQGYNEFQTEAELLTRVHHRNLTTLVGYCYEDNKMALVYEYMANGNLRKLLSDNNPKVLSWLERLEIALDAAQGLDYLHNGCKPPIIHRDIKSTNILLNEKFEAKLADFGLSRAFSAEDGSFVSTRVVGTRGYVDPEYYESHRLHEKSDIYSLGIVILELITGRAVFKANGDQRHITQWVNLLVVNADIGRIVDGKLKGDYDMNTAWKALEVAIACSSSSSSRRPAMVHVLKELSECLASERARREGLVTCSEDLLEVNPVTLDTELGPR